MPRSYKRAENQLRPLKIVTDISSYADGSVFFEIGKTKVLCTASITNNVPPFLRGKGKWWLTASYALLPASTKNRVERESIAKRNERSVEISRLIGRSLRSIVVLSNMGSEKTINIDCDVIQADGGTRTACITAAFVALVLAEQKWFKSGLIEKTIIQDKIAAISVGLFHEKALLDIDFVEDSNGVADFNFVMNKKGDIVEIQGSAEQKPITWHQVNLLYDVAYKGIQEILGFIDNEISMKNDNRLKVTLKDLQKSSL